MEKVYACLIGEWVCLNDDPDSKMGRDGQDPVTWFKNSAPVFAPDKRDPDTYHQFDYVEICYKGTWYRVNPIHIQVVYG